MLFQLYPPSENSKKLFCHFVVPTGKMKAKQNLDGSFFLFFFSFARWNCVMNEDMVHRQPLPTPDTHTHSNQRNTCFYCICRHHDMEVQRWEMVNIDRLLYRNSATDLVYRYSTLNFSGRLLVSFWAIRQLFLNSLMEKDYKQRNVLNRDFSATQQGSQIVFSIYLIFFQLSTDIE